MNIKLDCYLKVLGVIDISNTQQKVSELDWSSLITKSNRSDIENNVDFVILFNLPDKKNTLLQNLYYNKNLLIMFEDEIRHVQNIVDKHYKDFEPKRIFIDGLLPFKQIPPHIDSLYHHENTKRIHIPIITNDECFFMFSETKMEMKAGEITEFNNSVMHSAVNNSDTKRVHMIIDFGHKEDSYYGNVNSDWKTYIRE